MSAVLLRSPEVCLNRVVVSDEEAGLGDGNDSLRPAVLREGVLVKAGVAEYRPRKTPVRSAGRQMRAIQAGFISSGAVAGCGIVEDRQR